MKWSLAVDYERYTSLDIRTFDAAPTERELRCGVVVYSGLCSGIPTQVFISVDKVLGWELEATEEEEE